MVGGITCAVKVCNLVIFNGLDCAGIILNFDLRLFIKAADAVCCKSRDSTAVRLNILKLGFFGRDVFRNICLIQLDAVDIYGGVLRDSDRGTFERLCRE